MRPFQSRKDDRIYIGGDIGLGRHPSESPGLSPSIGQADQPPKHSLHPATGCSSLGSSGAAPREQPA